VSEVLETTGSVLKVLGNNNYLVEVAVGENTKEVLCHLGGKMRRFKINVIPGDEVTVEVPPPYDKGRITFRGKKTDLAERRAARAQRSRGRGKRR